MQMNYEDEVMKTTWKHGLLRVRIRNIQENTFDLLRIIFDAAVEEDRFNLAVDTRDMGSLSFRQIWKIANFAIEIKPKINHYVGKLSILTSSRYQKYIRFIMRHAGPTCPYYLGVDVKEAKQFVS